MQEAGPQALAPAAAALQRAAAAFAAILATDYWPSRSQDRRGGFVVADRMGLVEVATGCGRHGLLPAARWLRAALAPSRRSVLALPWGRHVVAHARLLWTLAHLLRHGFAPHPGPCRAALEHGLRYFIEVFQDRAEGGFCWRSDDAGRVVDDAKLLVAQSFAVYALVEIARATGEEEPIATALATFRRVQDALRDERHGGWHEIADRAWTPWPAGTVIREPGFRTVSGARSLNGHLHWMEALTELYRETGDAGVGEALAESLHVCLDRLAGRPGAPRLAATDAEWRPLPGENDEVTYGHLVELAWLAAAAARGLGREPDWVKLDALVDDALAWGFDSVRGGFFLSGPHGRPATRTDKLWWVQAEGLLALLQRVERAGTAGGREEAAFVALVDWVLGRQLETRRGAWVWATDAAGRPSNFVLAASWKAGYHEVRAMVGVIRAARARQWGAVANRPPGEVTG